MTVMMQALPRVANPYQREALLTSEQERAYIARIQAGYDPDAQAHLVRANIGLVGEMAKRFGNQGVEMDDLMQEGCLALIKVAQKFDVGSPFRFSTFATWGLRQAMQRCIENTGMLIRLPTYQHELIRRLKHDEEGALDDYSAEQIAEVRRAMQQVRSLETPFVSESGDLTLIDVLSESDETEEIALQAVQGQKLHAVLREVLTPRERYILLLRFGLVNDQEYTLAEVGTLVHLTRERVRQIEQAALAKLRDAVLTRTVLDDQEAR